MRLVTVVLVLLLAIIQYPLWWGHGGWLRVHELQQQLTQQTDKNNTLKLRNKRVQGEVQDLQNSTSAVEERARYEMGMVKDSEVFVQFVAPNLTAPVNSANTPGMRTVRRTDRYRRRRCPWCRIRSRVRSRNCAISTRRRKRKKPPRRRRSNRARRRSKADFVRRIENGAVDLNRLRHLFCAPSMDAIL